MVLPSPTRDVLLEVYKKNNLVLVIFFVNHDNRIAYENVYTETHAYVFVVYNSTQTIIILIILVVYTHYAWIHNIYYRICAYIYIIYWVYISIGDYYKRRISIDDWICNI